MNARRWNHAVPHLDALYRTGRLTPFIGSGMSRPRCADWAAFINRLCVMTGVSCDKGRSLDPRTRQQELLRLADDATRVLRRWGHVRRRDVLAHALFESDADQLDLPPQSNALAEFRWPLVITTNYDDVFWHASATKPWNRESFQIRGRSLPDCHAVLRGLDWPGLPILWAIQGFLGGPYRATDDLIPDAVRRDALLGELVIGHRQYQEAAHLNPHFRRAFAEVFRRRALLFLGSGIVDAYLTNLFSEVMLTQGQRAGSHFALLRENEVDDNQLRFLSDRLGVLAFTYEHYDEVEEFLARLLASAKHFMPAAFKSGPSPTESVVQVSSIRYRVARPDGIDISVALENSGLLDDTTRQRVLWAISVGRTQTTAGDVLHHGGMSQGVLNRLSISEAGFETCAVREYLYLHSAESRLVAVAARPTQEDDIGTLSADTRLPDPRSLSAIRKSMLALLDHAATTEDIDAVRVGLLSAGPTAPWHPLFSLVLMLAAVREFARQSRCSTQIEISIVDSRVWTSVISGTLPVQEILSAVCLPVLVQIESGTSDVTDTVVYMAEDGGSLEDVFNHLQLNASDWEWSMAPMAGQFRRDGQQPSEVALIPYATIVLHPCKE
jgi:hypothetical protein